MDCMLDSLINAQCIVFVLKSGWVVQAAIQV